MFGGCLFDPYRGVPCARYSYNPLVYELELMLIDHYTYGENGYLVGKNISDVIGGR